MASIIFLTASINTLTASKSTLTASTLYQERAVFGKMKMDPAKRAQTQNAGEVSSLYWFFSQSFELMTDKVWLHCIRPMLLKKRKLICSTIQSWFNTFTPEHKRNSSVHTGRFDPTSPDYKAAPLTTGPLQLWWNMWAGETKHYLRIRLLLAFSPSLLQAWMPVPES